MAGRNVTVSYDDATNEDGDTFLSVLSSNEDKETPAILAKVVDSLNEEEKELVTLRYVEGHSIKDVAEKYGCVGRPSRTEKRESSAS